jgi:hypothetical protein
MGCNGNLAWRAAQGHECKCHCEENIRSRGWDACCRFQARGVLNARMAAWYSLWLAVSGFSLPCGYGIYGIETVAALLIFIAGDLPDGRKTLRMRNPVQPCTRKYSASRLPQMKLTVCAVPAHKEQLC